MYRIIVDRHFHPVSGLELTDMITEKICVKSIRMIVIKMRTLLVGHLIMPFIIVVMPQNADLILTEIIDKAVCQRCLSASATARDSDQNSIHVNSSRPSAFFHYSFNYNRTIPV